MTNEELAVLLNRVLENSKEVKEILDNLPCRKKGKCPFDKGVVV